MWSMWSTGSLALIRTGTRGSHWLPGDPSHVAGVVRVMLPSYTSKRLLRSHVQGCTEMKVKNMVYYQCVWCSKWASSIQRV